MCAYLKASVKFVESFHYANRWLAPQYYGDSCELTDHIMAGNAFVHLYRGLICSVSSWAFAFCQFRVPIGRLPDIRVTGKSESRTDDTTPWSAALFIESFLFHATVTLRVKVAEHLVRSVSSVIHRIYHKNLIRRPTTIDPDAEL